MQEISQQAIATRAYELWEEEGRPHGRDLDHWTRAMSELLTRNGNGAAEPSPNGDPEPARKASAKAKPADPDAPAKPKRKAAKTAK